MVYRIRLWWFLGFIRFMKLGLPFHYHTWILPQKTWRKVWNPMEEFVYNPAISHFFNPNSSTFQVLRSPVSPGPLVSSAVASSALAMSPSEMPVPLEGRWGVLDPLSLWETSKNQQKRWKIAILTGIWMGKLIVSTYVNIGLIVDFQFWCLESHWLSGPCMNSLVPSVPIFWGYRLAS